MGKDRQPLFEQSQFPPHLGNLPRISGLFAPRHKQFIDFLTQYRQAFRRRRIPMFRQKLFDCIVKSNFQIGIVLRIGPDHKRMPITFRKTSHNRIDGPVVPAGEQHGLTLQPRILRRAGDDLTLSRPGRSGDHTHRLREQ